MPKLTLPKSSFKSEDNWKIANALSVIAAELHVQNKILTAQSLGRPVSEGWKSQENIEFLADKFLLHFGTERPLDLDFLDH